MISKLFNFFQSYFNISILLTSFVRPIFLTFRLQTKSIQSVAVYNREYARLRCTYLAKFSKRGDHHNGITTLFPYHSPHIIKGDGSRTFQKKLKVKTNLCPLAVFIISKAMILRPCRYNSPQSDEITGRRSAEDRIQSAFN